MAKSQFLPSGCASSHADIEIDDIRRPVWLEATESFYKNLNRIAKACQISRYQALSKGLDALMRESEIRNSALNRNIKSPSQSEVFRRTMGQVSRNYWGDGERRRAARTRKKKCSSQMEPTPSFWNDNSAKNKRRETWRMSPLLAIA